MPPNSVAHPRQPITRNYSPRGAHLLSDSGCNICFVYFSTTDIVHGKAVQFLLLHEDLSLQYVIPAVSLWYSNEMSRFVLRGSYFAVRTSRFVLRGSYFAVRTSWHDKAFRSHWGIWHWTWPLFVWKEFIKQPVWIVWLLHLPEHTTWSFTFVLGV